MTQLTNYPAPTVDTNLPTTISLAGTNLVKVGSQLVRATAPQNTAPSGVQYPAWFGNSYPGGADFDAVPADGVAPAGSTAGGNQYSLTLSLASATLNGVVLQSTCALTPSVYDAVGNSLSTAGVAYATDSPASGGFFNPPAAGTTYPTQVWSSQVVTLSGSTITANKVGQTVVTVSAPYATNVASSGSGVISARIVVEVIP